LRSEFDNDLQGIVSAAFDFGYTIDRFDLPWTETKNNKDASSPSASSGDFDLIEFLGGRPIYEQLLNRTQGSNRVPSGSLPLTT
jgi:hypothetical protein